MDAVAGLGGGGSVLLAIVDRCVQCRIICKCTAMNVSEHLQDIGRVDTHDEGGL